MTDPPYIRPTCYPAVSGGESVITLSLGELLFNLLQVVKRTINNTPQNDKNNNMLFVVIERNRRYGSYSLAEYEVRSSL